MKIINEFKNMELIKWIGFSTVFLTEIMFSGASIYFIIMSKVAELLAVLGMQLSLTMSIWGIKAHADTKKRNMEK
jgi:hypothetical protein